MKALSVIQIMIKTAIAFFSAWLFWAMAGVVAESVLDNDYRIALISAFLTFLCAQDAAARACSIYRQIWS